jgi:hypothetical protein
MSLKAEVTRWMTMTMDDDDEWMLRGNIDGGCKSQGHSITVAIDISVEPRRRAESWLMADHNATSKHTNATTHCQTTPFHPIN